MNFATVKAWLSKQTAVDWIAHGAAILLVMAFVGFQAWALYKGQRWDPGAFGGGATALVAGVTGLLYVKHKIKGNHS